jgi:predicted esterase
LGPAATAEASEDEIETGAIEVNIPEESNKCHAWVPENAAANIAHGVLIWLADAGDFEPKSLQEDWEVLCERYHFIVISPRPKNAQRWMATDVDFIHKVTEEVMSRYSVDPHRVVIGGRQTGAAIGFMAAFPRRDLIRGVVAIDAALPRAARVPANEPAQRFAAHFLVTEGSRITAAVDRSAERLSKMKYPVSVQRRNQTGKELKPEHRAELIRWADSLDRF